MTQKPSNKWILLRIVTPIAVAAMILSSCKDSENPSDTNDTDRTAFVVDSLLRENRKLTDSLDVVRERLDDCENARDNADSTEKAPAKRCPCPCKPQPAPKAPVVVKPQPKDTVKTEVTRTTAVPATQIIIGDQSENNGAIVVGNNNTTNNVVINGCTKVVLDTLDNIKTTRRIMSAHAKTTYTYTK